MPVKRSGTRTTHALRRKPTSTTEIVAFIGYACNLFGLSAPVGSSKPSDYCKDVFDWVKVCNAIESRFGTPKSTWFLDDNVSKTTLQFAGWIRKFGSKI